MLIGNVFEYWELYYAGSSLTALIWAAAMFFDIKQTNRSLEHHHEKALAKAGTSSPDKQSFSDYYPTERESAFPVKEREELIEIVKTSSIGLIEDKAAALFHQLKKFTDNDINTIRVRVKEIVFMLYDTVILAGADAPPLIQRLEEISQAIDDVTDGEAIFDIIIHECQYVAQTMVELSSHRLDNQSDNQLVTDIKTYLDTCYDKDISLNDVAAKMNVSRSHITQVFKATTQQTITQYLTDVRVNRAKILLLSHPVTDVAFDVGFNNPTYFSTVFKKLTGMTPSQYQQEAKQ
ncbi:helix-turn-helix transcriptional regulator [Vibrio sp. WXL210]|uniref:helix-turn-helix transcriptional regulator n=1 Tax=Vibrio sp. WXL210 TaxID=3450709 RepID=UPI003EC7EC42